MQVSRRIIATVFLLIIAAIVLASHLPFWLLLIGVSCFTAATVGRLVIWIRERRDGER